MPETQLNTPVRIFYSVNHELELFLANMIRRPVEFSEIHPEDRYEKGRYLASSYIGCHGYKLKGEPIPGAPPHSPKRRT